MQCLTQTIDGFIVSSPQPTEYTTCVYVLAQPSELGINAWALTSSQGIELAGVIGLLWATAFAFRVIGEFLRSNSNISKDE